MGRRGVTVTHLADARRRRAAARGAAIASVNPATGVTLQTFEPLDEAEIDARLALAAAVFPIYRRTPFAERARRMHGVADHLEAQREALGRVITTEMGKPLRAAVEEVAKCAWACRHYAEHAEALLADERIPTGPAQTFIRYQPLGPVLAVMPWNFPFWQVFRFAAPALMAGNVALLKHASNVPQCALAIEALFREAGFEEGVFQTLLVTSAQVDRVLGDDRVVAATLTGSDRAGAAVASEAGAKLKKTVLELGGSDPFIVMPSADLERAVATAVTARTINNGQSCIAAKRFIVAAPVYERFELRLVHGMRALVVGDPMDPATDVGPLVSAEALETLEAQVQRSVEAGARVLAGGRRAARDGFYYEPTVLADVPRDAPAYADELFGPVAVLLRADDVAAAIRLANDTRFGLGASVWTAEAAEQARFIDEIASGMVYVNAMVASDPRLPFGGIKHSGYGRELGLYGLREFVNVKTVWIADAPAGHRAREAGGRRADDRTPVE
jgi:succinate-semialdehyde dehydrogenase/glutarate-semialdehyde dehydrogenase